MMVSETTRRSSVTAPTILSLSLAPGAMMMVETLGDTKDLSRLQVGAGGPMKLHYYHGSPAWIGRIPAGASLTLARSHKISKDPGAGSTATTLPRGRIRAAARTDQTPTLGPTSITQSWLLTAASHSGSAGASMQRGIPRATRADTRWRSPLIWMTTPCRA